MWAQQRRPTRGVRQAGRRMFNTARNPFFFSFFYFYAFYSSAPLSSSSFFFPFGTNVKKKKKKKRKKSLRILFCYPRDGCGDFEAVKWPLVHSRMLPIPFFLTHSVTHTGYSKLDSLRARDLYTARTIQYTFYSFQLKTLCAAFIDASPSNNNFVPSK